MTKTILIVDENIETKQLKEGVFKFSNFRVKSASDGMEAIRMAKKGGIDVVLSDSPMDEIDEQDFVDQMKKSLSTKNIPIVMLSTSQGEDIKKIMQKKGVSKYIVKPFNVETLIKTVRKLADKDILYSQN